MSGKLFLRAVCGLGIALAFLYMAVSPVQAQAPSNDNFGDASVIGSTPFEQSLDTSEATLEAGEPIPDCWSSGPYPSPADSHDHTIWFAFSPEGSGLVQGYLAASFEAGLAVYTGTDLSNLEQVGCWAGLGEYVFSVRSGQAYYLQIGGLWGGAGSANLYLDLVPAPPNDDFADAAAITSTPYEQDLDTSSATIEEGEPIPSCSLDYFTPGHTIWYAYAASANGLVQGISGAYYSDFLAVYQGADEIACWGYAEDFSFEVQAGKTYYLQSGSMWGEAGLMHFYLDFIPAPSNDNFGQAMPISLGDSPGGNNTAATLEPGEPYPSCIAWYENLNRTVWFQYTPDSSRSVTADPSHWHFFVAAYTGSGLENLTEVGCQFDGNPLPFQVEAGQTYYLQVGSWFYYGYGEYVLDFSETPPPTADFGWSPGDPNIFENVEFCDWSDDPVYLGFTDFWWDFGDGASATGNCAYHQYPHDGDYTVFHNVQTSDGRTDSDGATRTVTVRTHDVAITRVTAPKAAGVGQTRPIMVYIKNNRYAERVEIQLYKSVPGGYELVGVTVQSIPVRRGNRTTAVGFSYTFTQGDADIGKVTFKAVANLVEARDALPADNEAISPPTKVQ